MLTRMTDEDWDRVVQVFRAVRSESIQNRGVLMELG